MSIKVKVYNQSAAPIKDLELSAKIFGVKANADLLHQAVITQQANERQVLAHTKDRSEVRGGGKKPWKQKGTGRARVGSSRSPLWVGGGVTFGPTKDRNFSMKMNKKMRQKAIMMCLSDKIAQSSLVIIDTLKMEEFKTKQFNAMLTAFEKEVLPADRRSLLIINGEKDEKARYSGRNLKGVTIINPENINIVDLITSRQVLMTEEGITSLEKQYSKK
ncbi:50S ribosomal protein L4 [Candidatus Falkowbacteria bacterium HGW-Falkowbacteria-2]|uniref:Large ribosomal subunit protein uL4 n=1 Tax=Candidatus Falkowbacteria bacterium HGW-Falkowbacteria-2 TaxID=2013769 RepID=A0A2N2DYM2_9BACT|nr:MAG: 50S ribosomal protein L4 [Candidatus Falkowbacteria bacterium HGW-Falkowbacteria-2]